MRFKADAVRPAFTTTHPRLRRPGEDRPPPYYQVMTRGSRMPVLTGELIWPRRGPPAAAGRLVLRRYLRGPCGASPWGARSGGAVSVQVSVQTAHPPCHADLRDPSEAIPVRLSIRNLHGH